MASVFLSYDRDDAKRARPIALLLEKAGHNVWWDLHVRGGAQFSKVIEEALKASEAVVVLWSANAVESPWVRDEAGAGRDTGRLVPVTLDGTDPPLGFRQYQTIDFSRWKGRGNAAELRTLLGDIETTALATAAQTADAPAEERRTASTAAPRRGAVSGTKGLAGLIALGVLILVAGGLYWLLGARRVGLPIVAVAAPDGSPLSQGMAQHVLVNLGSIAGGTATTNFRLMDDGSGGREDLRVSVSGAQVGGKIQATAALVSSADKAVLWSKQLEQPVAERGNLEQAIAFAAMGALGCAADASGDASARLKTDELRAYVSACVSLEQGGDPQPVVAVFRKTTAAAPRFAAGWSNLLTAEVHVFADLIDSSEPTAPLVAAIRTDVYSARKVDPDLPEAVIAEVKLQPPTAFLQSISMLDKALSTDPDSVALLNERSNELAAVGRVSDANEDAGRAAELKPYSPTLRADSILALANSGAIDRAWAELADAKKKWPDAPVIAGADSAMNIHFGDFEKSWRAAGRPIDGGILGYFKILRDPSDANIDAWVDLAKTHKLLRPHHLFILQVLGPLNRVDQLYDFLDQWPMEQDLQRVTFFLFRPWMAKVRRDPRFMRLAQRVGLLDYWEKSAIWPDFCAEPDMPYNCKKEAAKLHT